MNIQEEKNGEILTVKPEGRLDTLTSRTLEQYLAERYSGIRQLILDMAGVNYISSAGLRVIMQAYKKMKEKDGLRLRNVCDQVMDVLKLTGFANVLTIDP